MKEATGLTDLKFCFVHHCLHAQAVSLTFSTGFKFSYSGDCRPSQRFAQIGKGSTVLLHEATFDDELKSEAEAKNHSTTSEAIGVGIAMGARRILLTHFSQRYQKLPVLSGIENHSIKLEDEPDPNDTTDNPDIIENIDPQMPDSSLREHSNEIESTPQPTISSSHPTEPTAQYRPCFPQPTNSPSRPTEPTVSYHSLFPSSPSHNDLKVAIAFDYMRVKVRDIIHLEKFTPALQKLYQNLELDELAHEGVAMMSGEAPGAEEQPGVKSTETQRKAFSKVKERKRRRSREVRREDVEEAKKGAEEEKAQGKEKKGVARVGENTVAKKELA